MKYLLFRRTTPGTDYIASDIASNIVNIGYNSSIPLFIFNRRLKETSGACSVLARVMSWIFNTQYAVTYANPRNTKLYTIHPRTYK
jgi:hypothetical protein